MLGTLTHVCAQKGKKAATGVSQLLNVQKKRLVCACTHDPVVGSPLIMWADGDRLLRIYQWGPVLLLPSLPLSFRC